MASGTADSVTGDALEGTTDGVADGTADGVADGVANGVAGDATDGDGAVSGAAAIAVRRRS